MDRQERADRVYQQIKSHLDARNFTYSPRDEERIIVLTAQGDSLPMPVLIRVHGDRQIVHLISTIPGGGFPEDRRADAAVAIALINDRLMNGAFTLDPDEGRIVFRVCQSFHDNILTEEQIHYLFSILFTTVNEYNVSLHKLESGAMTLEQFVKKTQE